MNVRAMREASVLLRADDPRRTHIEEDLAKRRLSLPVEHTLAWLRFHPDADSWLLVLTDANREPVGAIPLAINQTRVMPGHFVVRAERVGACLPVSVCPVAVEALLRELRRTPRALRLDLDLYAIEEATRSALIDELRRLKFNQESDSRFYVRTCAIDLRPDPHELFENLHRSLKKQLRQIETSAHRVLPIVETRFAERIDALHRETMQRTAGPYATMNWRQHIEFSAANPGLSHVNGLFLDGRSDPEHLAAIRWCIRRGDHVQDFFAASMRGPKIPMMAAVVWEQLLWARREGAQWFDFGGVPNEELPSDHPLERIADFKRKFSGSEIVVGGQWSMELRPIRNRVATILRRMAAAVVAPR